ncbi:MAG: hypothetical protein AAF962_13425 [Actinomycetota bacterium]
MLSLFALLLFVQLLYITIGLWLLDRGRLGHVVDFYVVGFAGFFLFRAGLLVMGLDSFIFPALGSEGVPDQARAVEDALVALVVWQALVSVGVVLGRRLVAPRRLVGGSLRAISTSRLRHLLLVAAAVGSAVAVAVVASEAGGIEDTIAASKAEKALGGLFFLQFIPIAGMLWASHLALDERDRLKSLCYWISSTGFAATVMIWGSRRVLVVLAALIVVSMLRSSVSARIDLARLVLLAPATIPLLLGLSIALRRWRDGAIGGGISGKVASEPIWRQASLSANATYFEAFTLATRDFPEVHSYWGAQPFMDGLLGVVPRLLWSGKPEGVAIGAEFRQIYEPQILNGWPVGGVGEWYLSFGWFGLLVGALLSGFLLSALGNTIRKYGSLPFAAAFGLQILELGFGGQSAVRWFGWIVPTLLVVWFIEWQARQEAVGRLRRDPDLQLSLH